MNTVLSALALAAGIVSGAANASELASPNARSPVEFFVTTYQALEPFYHVAADRSYIGSFESKTGVCAVSLQIGPANVKANDGDTEQTRFDLPARETITFIVDDAGAALKLRCAPDGKSLVINQTWAARAEANAAAQSVGGKQF